MKATSKLKTTTKMQMTKKNDIIYDMIYDIIYAMIYDMIYGLYMI